MKTAYVKIMAILLLVSTVFISCEKQGEAPVLPPTESMLMDFSSFENNSKSGVIDDTTAYNNWGSSALTVGFWSIAVYINSVVPVVAFQEAFRHDAVFVSNATWEWTYTKTYGQANYTCRLEATVNSETTDWKMYVSKSGGVGTDYTDHLWFTGTSANDLTTATWHLNRGPELSGRAYLDVVWVKETSLRYTLVDETEEGYGNYLEYDKIDEAGLDAQFIIRTINQTYDIDIQWNKANENGRVKCQNWYSDLNWHCWDENHKNILCE